MCVLCGAVWTEDHWAEVATERPVDAPDGTVRLEVHTTRRGQRLRDRAHRADLASRVLAGCGLSVQDWEGSSYIIRDQKGSTSVVFDQASLWPSAERILGRVIDPLDPELLAGLGRDPRDHR